MGQKFRKKKEDQCAFSGRLEELLVDGEELTIMSRENSEIHTALRKSTKMTFRGEQATKH